MAFLVLSILNNNWSICLNIGVLFTLDQDWNIVSGESP